MLLFSLCHTKLSRLIWEVVYYWKEPNSDLKTSSISRVYDCHKMLESIFSSMKQKLMLSLLSEIDKVLSAVGIQQPLKNKFL